MAMKRLILGVIGAGGDFARYFLPLFKAHPLVGEVRIAELREDRRVQVAKTFGIERTYRDHRELCADKDVDAVLIFTERMKHVPFALSALAAGKHVYSAVPAASSLEELHSLVEAVKQTGLVYMMGETSLYYPGAVYCRQKYRAGEFGRFVYGEGEYYHDMAEPGCSFYDIYQQAHGEQWRKFAGFPPMLYPTHSVSVVLGVTGARAVSVSCIGLDDSEHEDGCWGKGKNLWDNPYSSQSALFRTSDGGMMRINEFRRVGTGEQNHVRLSIFGTKASFEQQPGGERGNYSWSMPGKPPVDLADLLGCQAHYNPAPDETRPDKLMCMSSVHDVARLPEEFKGMLNGHYGSHQFLVDDFVKACVYDRVPPGNVWDAARFNAPGIVAHASAMKDGEVMAVPDFGTPPPGRELPAEA
jgi:predicted dehydrogenase